MKNLSAGSPQEFVKRDDDERQHQCGQIITQPFLRGDGGHGFPGILDDGVLLSVCKVIFILMEPDADSNTSTHLLRLISDWEVGWEVGWEAFAVKRGNM